MLFGLLYHRPHQLVRWMVSGSLMISFYSTEEKPAFWRIPNINPEISHEHMWAILKIVNRWVRDELR